MRWVKLGDYIEQCDERNTNGHDYPVMGINKDKEFMPTVANISEIDTKKYKIVRPGIFVFSGMQTGRDVCIRIGLYNDRPCLISPAYTTFKVINDELLPEFLFMYFNRLEMDRYGWFISDSSVRSNLDWNRFVDIEIPLPDMDTQRAVVNAWNGLKKLKAQNEQMAIFLYQLCYSNIEFNKHKFPMVRIGQYIHRGKKNTNQNIKQVMGIGQRGFIKPQKVPNESLKNYKILTHSAICYAPPLYNILCDAIHLYDYEVPSVCSPIYEVFYCDENTMLPIYLLLWLKRDEFKRYAEFYSLGVRNTFDYALMEDVKIPISPMDVQRAVVAIYKCAQKCKQIANDADNLAREICPALMQQVTGGAE